MILLSIIPLVIFGVILLQSESFWNNLSSIIIAFSTLVAAVFAGLATIFSRQANVNAKEANVNAKVAVEKTVENKVAIDAVQKTTEEVKHTTNSKMDLLLAGKDELAKTIADNKIVEDRMKASFNEGKIETMEQKEKDDLLRNTQPPQNMPPPQYPPPPPPPPPQYPDEMSKSVADKVSDKVADRIVEKVGDDVGDKVVEKVVNEVITEKDDELKKKPD